MDRRPHQRRLDHRPALERPGQRCAFDPRAATRARCTSPARTGPGSRRFAPAPSERTSTALEEELAREQRAVQLPLRENALAQRSARKAIIVSPTAFRLWGDTAVGLSQCMCQQSKSKSIRSIAGTPARMNGTWSSRTAPCSRTGKWRAKPVRRDAARSLPRAGGSRTDRAGSPLSPDEVEDDRGLRGSEGARGDLAPRAARTARTASPSARRLLAVEEDDDERRLQRPRLDRARELADDCGSRGGVVRADEAGEILGVVVGAEHDLPPRGSGRDRADDVPQPARHGLEAAVRDRAAEDLGGLAGFRRARRPRAECDLPLQECPGGGAVEPVRARRLPRGAVFPGGGSRENREQGNDEQDAAHGRMVPQTRNSSVRTRAGRARRGRRRSRAWRAPTRSADSGEPCPARGRRRRRLRPPRPCRSPRRCRWPPSSRPRRPGAGSRRRRFRPSLISSSCGSEAFGSYAARLVAELDERARDSLDERRRAADVHVRPIVRSPGRPRRASRRRRAVCSRSSRPAAHASACGRREGPPRRAARARPGRSRRPSSVRRRAGGRHARRPRVREVAQHRPERHDPGAAGDEEQRPTAARLPDEVPADRASELEPVAGLQLVGEVRRDLAVLDPLDRQLELRRPGAEAIE